MSLAITDRVANVRMPSCMLLLCVGAGAYLQLLFTGDLLLQDSDTYWHIKIGQWIIDHGAVPTTDFFSFTRAGSPWMSNAWLSQVLYAASYAQAGWAGPVVLASLAIATTLVIFVNLLKTHFEPAHRVLLAMLAFVLSWHHLLARPHVLALPLMVAWVGGLIRAIDQRSLPSWRLLPLMTLWANLHGGFVLGLALMAPLALEAVWHAENRQRLTVVKHWGLFGVAAVIASCCTPYLHNTLIAAANIMDLGEVLTLIAEWRPADFSSFGAFEATLLGVIGLAFYRGVALSLPRIALLLTLTQMALSHVRCIEAFAFLMPLAMARPFSDRAAPQADIDVTNVRTSPLVAMLAMLAVAGGALVSTLAYAAHHDFVFVKTQVPEAALAVLRQHQAKRIFNAYEFGGYLIANDVPTFIDGRAELYGERYVLNFFNAVAGHNLDQFADMLDQFDIDATLLAPNEPGTQLLDHLPGWTRLYADDVAVVHVRTKPPMSAVTLPGTR
jgi:hypothetical protein